MEISLRLPRSYGSRGSDLNRGGGDWRALEIYPTYRNLVPY
jgi:hypothetical protein